MSYESESLVALKIDILAANKELTSIKERLKQGEILVTHQSDRYRIVIERAASTKGIDGFKVEANGDEIVKVGEDAEILYNYAKGLTNPTLSASIDRKESP